MHSDETTNVNILLSNLRANNDENIVLIKTGALNPVHRSHISNLVQTKQYLEDVYHFHVLGGYISPTHDEYVYLKLRDDWITGECRIAMCEKAIEEAGQQSWLSVDKAECMAKEFVDLSIVSSSLQKFINDKLKLSTPIRVIYVCGLDLFNRCGGLRSLRYSKMGVAVVYRPGEQETIVKQAVIKDSNIFYVPIKDEIKWTLEDVSSTLIRKTLKNNQSCEHLTYTSVIDYLRTIPIRPLKHKCIVDEKDE
ncbi:unnamed protein product [Didymodactylos carnosus]|uniref:Cytidyltransferase-like domain-containing protein n=1 Tax=Didymodactylos carnosus TaxID=1234261 RepID=A0A815DIJ3_9BILA|nr:unnamed protein product [Didymodactylos carnosus]CAF1298370.1 unnamed protein product [Didymodactylos carnosus]CAF3627873.1 unnamed protein product [Didymodactylos carnosus]CAF4117357.1 unnamed protein product [Didymodactylos carnosus]